MTRMVGAVPKIVWFGRGAKHWVKIAEALVFEVNGPHGPVGFTNVHRENHIVQLENVDLGFHSPSPHVFVAILLAGGSGGCGQTLEAQHSIGTRSLGAKPSHFIIKRPLLCWLADVEIGLQLLPFPPPSNKQPYNILQQSKLKAPVQINHFPETNLWWLLRSAPVLVVATELGPKKGIGKPTLWRSLHRFAALLPTDTGYSVRSELTLAGLSLGHQKQVGLQQFVVEIDDLIIQPCPRSQAFHLPGDFWFLQGARGRTAGANASKKVDAILSWIKNRQKILRIERTISWHLCLFTCFHPHQTSCSYTFHTGLRVTSTLNREATTCASRFWATDRWCPFGRK